MTDDAAPLDSDPLFAADPVDPVTEAKERYIAGRNFTVGDVVCETEKGRWVVQSIKRAADGTLTPIFGHRVKPGGVKRPPKAPEEVPEDIAAYAAEKLVGGKKLVDFFVNMMNDTDLAAKDRAWAAERLRVMTMGKGALGENDAKGADKGSGAFLLPDNLPEITYDQLARINTLLRECGINPDAPDAPRAGGTEAADDAAVEPAPAVPEAGDVS